MKTIPYEEAVRAIGLRMADVERTRLDALKAASVAQRALAREMKTILVDPVAMHAAVRHYLGIADGEPEGLTAAYLQLIRTAQCVDEN